MQKDHPDTIEEPKTWTEGWDTAQKEAVFGNLIFLELPAEVRVMIYECCLANAVFTLNSIKFSTQSEKSILNWTIDQPIPVFLFRLCRQVFEEASKVFWDNAQLRLVAEAGRSHAWVDGSMLSKASLRCTTKQHKYIQLTNLVQNFKNLYLVASINGPEEDGQRVYTVRNWLDRRKTSRRYPIVFAKMPALRRVQISFIREEFEQGDQGLAKLIETSDINSTDGVYESLSSAVSWLVEAIPIDVELQWVAFEELSQSPGTYVSPVILRELEKQHHARRATARNLPKDKRQKLPHRLPVSKKRAR